MPRAEVSKTMLWVLTIWSYSVSITGAACWNKSGFRPTRRSSASREGAEKSGSAWAVMPYPAGTAMRLPDQVAGVCRSESSSIGPASRRVDVRGGCHVVSSSGCGAAPSLHPTRLQRRGGVALRGSSP